MTDAERPVGARLDADRGRLVRDLRPPGPARRAGVSPPAAVKRDAVSFFAAYAALGRDIAALWRESRQTFWFLLASAIFRDGLTGVFTFGGVLAAGTFGFSAGEVIIFAIAANVVAGISTIVVGRSTTGSGRSPSSSPRSSA